MDVPLGIPPFSISPSKPGMPVFKKLSVLSSTAVHRFLILILLMYTIYIKRDGHTIYCFFFKLCYVTLGPFHESPVIRFFRKALDFVHIFLKKCHFLAKMTKNKRGSIFVPSWGS